MDATCLSLKNTEWPLKTLHIRPSVWYPYDVDVAKQMYSTQNTKVICILLFVTLAVNEK